MSSGGALASSVRLSVAASSSATRRWACSALARERARRSSRVGESSRANAGWSLPGLSSYQPSIAFSIASPSWAASARLTRATMSHSGPCCPSAALTRTRPLWSLNRNTSALSTHFWRMAASTCCRRCSTLSTCWRAFATRSLSAQRPLAASAASRSSSSWMDSARIAARSRASASAASSRAFCSRCSAEVQLPHASASTLAPRSSWTTSCSCAQSSPEKAAWPLSNSARRRARTRAASATSARPPESSLEAGTKSDGSGGTCHPLKSRSSSTRSLDSRAGRTLLARAATPSSAAPTASSCSPRVHASSR
mmetsp:Transcript_109214/g.296102  ORF Transcript_109214/g.296102 Transcript_109214/m.296102 type:complete len:310 (-) Transcript_109214:1162-2091(-)